MMSEEDLIKLGITACLEIVKATLHPDADAKTMFRKMKQIGELGLTECGDEPVEEDR